MPLNFGFKSNCKLNNFLRDQGLTQSASSHLIEIANDLVQQAQALQALLIDVCLIVELLVVGYGGKHDGHAGVALVIQLRGAFQVQKVCGHVSRQNVLQQNLREYFAE